MTRPGLSQFQDMAQDALNTLPAPFRDAAQEVVIQIVDWPSQDMLDDLEIADPLDLTGLYEGIPLTKKSVWDQPYGPDVIWLFRRPILAEWHDRGNIGLPRLVAHVLVHELAHHFGWSDDDIAQIDRWWE
ncbi:metallopeptidase family protein [Mesobacterium sp. TK19101]|uniref:Metallopeptidase family protein n=1 Tax=Mesobacterium hydrothermale TaxID=3111907 RepID=A0ABU6HDE5_9RHOB|nr:metallopeptidase family protein [Mesobacterium sp. TK19101]MEC3859659.1 metallopeptidase family protein [Mesobacterium sp. TK19101]